MNREDLQRILLAEDDKNFGRVLKSELEDDGYIVDLSCDGVEAILDFIGMGMNHAFAIVDIRMPKLDGINTLRILKKLKRDIPAVAISGNAGSGEMEEALKAGALHCLTKPFEISRIKEIIGTILEDNTSEKPKW